jgi:hypothetical protein
MLESAKTDKLKIENDIRMVPEEKHELIDRDLIVLAWLFVARSDQHHAAFHQRVF